MHLPNTCVETLTVRWPREIAEHNELAFQWIRVGKEDLKTRSGKDHASGKEGTENYFRSRALVKSRGLWALSTVCPYSLHLGGHILEHSQVRSMALSMLN